MCSGIISRSMTRRHLRWIYAGLALALVALFCGGLLYGAVRIPLRDIVQILLRSYEGKEAWQHIVLESRLPQTVTALLAGSSLAVSGLMLQTLFKNPLAGPSILGISDGANLGVAIAMIYLGAASYLTTIVAALTGAFVVLLIILGFSRKVTSNVMLLIIGIMVGYLASSVISILNYHASADKVHQYVMWGMGDFSGVSLSKLPWLAGFSLAGLLGALLLIKPLNALLLGARYAENLGVNILRVRNWLLIVTGLLTAVTTAFCGPVAFIGLAVPHIARLLLTTDNHRVLLPATILCGAVVALICNLICFLPGESGVIPLNAVTPLIGAPVIIYVIARKR